MDDVYYVSKNIRDIKNSVQKLRELERHLELSETIVKDLRLNINEKLRACTEREKHSLRKMNVIA